MKYNKPEIDVLGEATALIHGLSGSAQESNKVDPNFNINDGELDD